MTLCIASVDVNMDQILGVKPMFDVCELAKELAKSHKAKVKLELAHDHSLRRSVRPLCTLSTSTMAEPLQTFVNSLLYRVYKGNTQRLNTNLKSLNSHAAFLVVLEEEKLIYVWIGSLCRPEDAALTNEIGEAVLSKDFQSENDEDEIPNLLEGSEAPDLLEAMLDILWSTKELYNSKNAVKQRRLPVVNSSVSVGIIERAAWSDTYDFQETSFAYTDSYGTLPRVTFAPISASTVAYVNTGDHWDVWFARAVPWQEIERVIIFLRNTVAEHLALPDNAFTKTVYLPQYIVIVRQGREGTLFKQGLKLFTDFEPTSKAIMRPEPAPRMKKDKKHIVEERKSAKIVATKDSGALGLGLGSVLGLGLGSGSGSDSVSSPKSKKLPRVASVGFWGVDEKPASPSSFWAPVSTKSFDKTVPPPPPGQSTRQSVKSVSKDSYEDKVTVPVGEVQVVQFSSKDAVVGM
ncbi:hypothetical protein B484DRAFT_391312, partial [Ochromonadaceae sp. CCMP2298]